MLTCGLQRSDHGPTRWTRCRCQLHPPVATAAHATAMVQASAALSPSPTGARPALAAVSVVEWVWEDVDQVSASLDKSMRSEGHILTRTRPPKV